MKMPLVISLAGLHRSTGPLGPLGAYGKLHSDCSSACQRERYRQLEIHWGYTTPT